MRFSGDDVGPPVHMGYALQRLFSLSLDKTSNAQVRGVNLRGWGLAGIHLPHIRPHWILGVVGVLLSMVGVVPSVILRVVGVLPGMVGVVPSVILRVVGVLPSMVGVAPSIILRVVPAGPCPAGLIV